MIRNLSTRRLPGCELQEGRALLAPHVGPSTWPSLANEAGTRYLLMRVFLAPLLRHYFVSGSGSLGSTPGHGVPSSSPPQWLASPQSPLCKLYVTHCNPLGLPECSVAAWSCPGPPLWGKAACWSLSWSHLGSVTFTKIVLSLGFGFSYKVRGCPRL